MKDQTDILRRILELSETIEEGLEHIHSQLKKGKIESTITLMEDVLTGYAEVEKSIQAILPELSSNELGNISSKLQKAFDLIIGHYENGRVNKVGEVMQFNLLPTYKAWRHEARRVLEPSVVA
ncbi:hypothetical protein [Heliorestis convoluta]|uniref:DUF8042 domain-containing protein n=1 Tax=Heliorestis convoluta TaxID=356322 RepID=A0A5Q2N5H1_9FIRM|nr:hypothetical protein [Heliorestis convoluta]QGG48876.1 hypothetical protein FTV88_2787 [Heliorestis convoluta]